MKIVFLEILSLTCSFYNTHVSLLQWALVMNESVNNKVACEGDRS